MYYLCVDSTQESDHLSQYESQFSSREISKSPTTSSIHDSSNDVLDQGSILMSEDEGDSNVTVEGPGVNMMTVTGGESMVLDSGQVSLYLPSLTSGHNSNCANYYSILYPSTQKQCSC